MSVLTKTALKSAITSAFATSVVNTDVITQLHNVVDSYEDFIASLTQSQINALTPIVSQIVFNTDLGQLQYYDGSQWQSLASTSDAIMSVTRTLTSAEILDLFTTSIELIPSQGLNRVIVPIQLIYQYTFVDEAYDTDGNDIEIKLGEAVITTIADTVLESASDLIGTSAIGAVTLIDNQELIIKNSTANPVDGDGTLTVTIYYRVISI
jgi:hypothetical protein